MVVDENEQTIFFIFLSGNRVIKKGINTKWMFQSSPKEKRNIQYVTEKNRKSEKKSSDLKWKLWSDWKCASQKKKTKKKAKSTFQKLLIWILHEQDQTIKLVLCI